MERKQLLRNGCYEFLCMNWKRRYTHSIWKEFEHSVRMVEKAKLSLLISSHNFITITVNVAVESSSHR
jgi:hypothetical protein